MRPIRAISRAISFSGRRDSQVDLGAGVSAAPVAAAPSVPAEPEAPETECPICFDALGENRIVCSPCGHSACKECTKANCEFLIKNGSPEILCVRPQCASRLSHYQILDLFQNDQEMIDKYERFSVEKALLQMDDVVRCPRPGCSLAVIVCPGSDEVECSACKNLFCPKCRLESHPGVSCKRFKKWSVLGQTREEKMFRTWKNKTENVKKCPKCKIVIHKISGCNMMVCSQCRYNFCWLCGGKTYSGHFEPYNPFGCAGQQHSESTNMGKRAAIRVGVGLGYLVGVPLVLALSPIVGIPYGCVVLGKMTKEAIRRRKRAREARKKRRESLSENRFKGFNVTEDTVISGPNAVPVTTTEAESSSGRRSVIRSVMLDIESRNQEIDDDVDSVGSADSGTESEDEFENVDLAGDGNGGRDDDGEEATTMEGELKDLQTAKRILDRHYAADAQSLGGNGSTNGHETESVRRDRVEIYSDHVSVLEELVELAERGSVLGADPIGQVHRGMPIDAAAA